MAEVISKTVMSIAAIVVEKAIELPILENNSSIINKTEMGEWGVSEVRRIKEKEEEKGEKEKGGE